MKRSTVAFLACWTAVLTHSRADPAETFAKTILPLLESRCVACHGPAKAKAKIDFSGARSLEKLTADPHLWFRVLDQLNFGEMPPEDADEPLADADRARIVSWIEGELTDSFAARRLAEGRSQFRRLNRVEFSDQFEDLFGIRPDVSLLPQDGRVEGFTKIAEALPMSTDGAYGYYQIARDLLEKWVLKPLPNPEKNPSDATTHRLAAMESGQSAGHTLELPDGWFVSFNSDDTSGRLRFGGGTAKGGNDFSGARTPGLYRLRAHIYAYQSDQPLTVGIYAGHTGSYPQQIELVQIIEAPPGRPAVVETEAYLGNHPSGVNSFRLVPFGLGEQVPKNSQASRCQGPGLAIQWVEVDQPARPIFADRLLTADFPEDLKEAMRRPQAYLREKGPYNYNGMSADDFTALMQKTAARVGARLWHRDLTPAELAAVTAAVRADLVAEKNLRDLFFDRITDLMTSPEFFCVNEAPGRLSEFALASRLALFLWNSGPDEALLDLARAGKLADSAVLRRETDRLIDDPRSDRFVKHFLNQWLDLHAISDTTPDNKLYPEYGDDLKFSSLRETEGTFRRVLRENRSVADFVAPDWLMVNERLARHYGIPAVAGAALRPAPLPKDSPYGGLWAQPAILKVTADGSSTSPVKRGVWIAKRLLGVHVSPPPPNIEPINPDTSGAKTLREQLALHSSKGSCAGCHQKFDPYGFALESFDVMGQYRKHYRQIDPRIAALSPQQRKGKTVWADGLPVDASGVTPDGKEFTDIVALREILKTQPEKLAWGVTWHLATHATGTPSGPLDRRAIQAIVDGAAKEGHGLRSLVHGLVQSELFRTK